MSKRYKVCPLFWSDYGCKRTLMNMGVFEELLNEGWQILRVDTMPPTAVEIEAVAKRLLWRSCKKWDGIESDYVAKDEDDAWDYAGEICGYREDFIDRAKEVLEVERHAVTE